MLGRAHFAGIMAIGSLVPMLTFGAGANAYVQRNLVADIAGQADVTDPNLVNPWGVSFSGTGAFWVSNQGKGNSTLYNGSGIITPLVVPVPAANGTGQGTPTGQVFNGSATAFLLPGVNRAATFIFATEDGTISGWANGIPNNLAIVTANNSAVGAVYTGLAIGSNASGPLLYAANFNSGKIDVFDSKYNATTVAGGFNDPNLPAGYAPFNIWPVGGKLYVLYAQQDSKKQNSVAGAGLGYVDVFDFDGNLQKRLISGGALNAPWGVALAPSTFGAFAGN
ncbi:MAG TPA: TIGR03118 family protein, partial [Bryobacteraceae bacterium]|nr:TIGR03118 family protein [Bryobacteraceae bacterium]